MHGDHNACAMSSDEKSGSQRAINRPRVPAGPLADLKALLYELYLQAGTPTLDEIAAWITADQQATGSPSRDTVARIIGGTRMPPSQADVTTVAAALARAVRWDARDTEQRARDLWVAAKIAAPAGEVMGVTLEEVTDPFALEVHRPIEAEGAAAGLPRYVRREHDGRLAQVVDRAVGGTSVMAVLVAGLPDGILKMPSDESWTCGWRPRWTSPPGCPWLRSPIRSRWKSTGPSSLRPRPPLPPYIPRLDDELLNRVVRWSRIRRSS
jgi:hypothetical protein